MREIRSKMPKSMASAKKNISAHISHTSRYHVSDPFRITIFTQEKFVPESLLEVAAQCFEQQQEIIEKAKDHTLSIPTEVVAKGLNPGKPMHDKTARKESC